MPRCFMAKKLKYPYEQWKEKQQASASSSGSRSPSPCHSPANCEDDDAAHAPHKRIRTDAGHDAFWHAAAAAMAAAGLPTPPAAHLLASRHFGYAAAAFLPTQPQPFTAILPPPAAHRNSASSSLTPPPETAYKPAVSPSTPSLGKKDLFRPYCLQDPRADRPAFSPPAFHSHLQHRNLEDLSTAHAILDLSRSSRYLESSASKAQSVSSSPSSPASPSSSAYSEHSGVSASSSSQNLVSSSQQLHQPSPLLSPALSTASAEQAANKTTAYTYEAFFASDGRSKKRVAPTPDVEVPVEVASGSSKARYTCSECGKNYATSSNLSRHKQTHRSLDSGNAKKCNVCGKMYVSMPALSMHILTHNLNHKCDVCGKAFSRPWLLQGHMRSHSGDKPYGCAHCGKSFADRSNLRAHMQTHSAFKNFKCKRCNKSFALKSYLNKHYESACFKDEPIPEIETPPVTPAPSDVGSDAAMGDLAHVSGEAFSPAPSSSSAASPSSSSSAPSIGAILAMLPSPHGHSMHHHQHLVRV